MCRKQDVTFWPMFIFYADMTIKLQRGGVDTRTQCRLCRLTCGSNREQMSRGTLKLAIAFRFYFHVRWYLTP